MKHYIQYNIGKSKYVVNFSDGSMQHKDGSEFWCIKIFHNKKKMGDFIKSLYADKNIMDNWRPIAQ